MQKTSARRLFPALAACLLLCAGLFGCGAQTAGGGTVVPSAGSTKPCASAPQAPAGPSSSVQPAPDRVGNRPSVRGRFQGCAVLYAPASGQYSLYQPQMCETRFSPYSTFKIISACMGLHNGVLESEDSRMHYSGAQYPVPAWNADLSLKEAFQSSCVWYFRQVIENAWRRARRAGAAGAFLRQLRHFTMGGQRHQPSAGYERLLAGGFSEGLAHRTGTGPGADIQRRRHLHRTGDCRCEGHDAGGRSGKLEVIWENRHRACGRGMVHRVCAERQPKPLLCFFLEQQCLRAGALRRYGKGNCLPRLVRRRRRSVSALRGIILADTSGGQFQPREARFRPAPRRPVSAP